MDSIKDRSRLAKYVLQVPAFAVADMSPAQLAIYMQYAYRCGQAGGAWIGGLGDVADGAGMSVNTARAARQWLIDNRWLIVVGENARGALEIEIADRWSDALAAADLGSVVDENNLIRSDVIKSDQIRSDQVGTVNGAQNGNLIKSDQIKSDQVGAGAYSTESAGDVIKSDQVGADSSRSLPRSSSRSITIDPSTDPEKATTTTAGGVNGRPLAWVSADRLTDCERAAYDALQAAGIDGTAATTVRTFGVGHCINHAAAFLADAENDPALRPAALIWRIHNRPAPSPSSLRGEWRRWWDRYADRAGLLDGDDPVVPAPAAESGPEDAPDPYADKLPELRALVRDLEITGMARTELDFYFGAAAGRLEDGGDVLRILHPDGARLSYLRDRLGNRIRLSLPAGVRSVVFGEGGAV